MPPLREVRIRHLLSIQALAREASVATRTIVEAEAGRQRPRLKTMRKLAAALGVEPTEIDEFRAAIEAALRGNEDARE